MSHAWVDGAHNEELDLEVSGQLMVLYLMVANGLEGDVRMVGETADAVAALRGLLLGAGSCEAIDPPTCAPLYRPGDECFRQHAKARAFLDPRPRLAGSVLSPPRAPSPVPVPAPPPPPPAADADPQVERLEATFCQMRDAERATGSIHDQLDRGFVSDEGAAFAQAAANDRVATEAMATLEREVARLRRRSPDVVLRWATKHLAFHRAVLDAARAASDRLAIHVEEETLAGWQRVIDGDAAFSRENDYVLSKYARR